MNTNNHCPVCHDRLTSVKLYAPEILRLFTGGNKVYNKHDILTSYSVCLNKHCADGEANIQSYQNIVDNGMIKGEE